MAQPFKLVFNPGSVATMEMIVSALIGWFGPEIILGLVIGFVWMVVQYVRNDQ